MVRPTKGKIVLQWQTRGYFFKHPVGCTIWNALQHTAYRQIMIRSEHDQPTVLGWSCSGLLSIVSVNSVTFACCKLYVCQDFALKMSTAYCCFWVVHLPVAKQRIFNCSVLTVSFFMLSINFWKLWWKRCDLVTHGCKLVVH